MSGYRKYVDIPVTIEGVSHVVRLKSMTFEQALTLSDAGSAIDDKNAKWRAQIVAARKLLPSVGVSITPDLKDADGADVSLAEVFESQYFYKAANEIATEWINKANPANPS